MAIVNGIATVLMAIVSGIATFFDVLISCLTCGGCGRGRGLGSRGVGRRGVGMSHGMGGMSQRV